MSDAHQLIELSRKEDLPVFSAGDTVNVTFKITEGDRERQQAFLGTVIKKRSGYIVSLRFAHQERFHYATFSGVKFDCLCVCVCVERKSSDV